jgi:hypothetical protein
MDRRQHTPAPVEKAVRHGFSSGDDSADGAGLCGMRDNLLRAVARTGPRLGGIDTPT